MNKTFSNRDKGMTLIEVLIAIALIGIIAVTFLPIITNSFVNVVNSGDKTKGMYNIKGLIEMAIANKKSIKVDGEDIIFQKSEIPIKFGNKEVTISGGKIIKDKIVTFVPDVPTILLEPDILYEGYPSNTKITVKSVDIKFLNNSTYKLNGQPFSPSRRNDNELELQLPSGAINAWKNEHNPYKFEVETGTTTAMGIIQILQPKAMIVGNYNDIKISSDFQNNFKNWRNRNTDNHNGLNSILYIDSNLGNGYIAVGNKGKILTFHNGFGWKNIDHKQTENNLLDIASGNENLTVVGENGTILHSTSKDIWNTMSSNFSKALMGVEYGLLGNNEYFVAVGENGAWLCWNLEGAWNLLDWDIEYPSKKEEIESQTFNDIISINYKTENDQQKTSFVAVGTNGSILKNSSLIGGGEVNSWTYNEITSNSLNTISFNKNETNPILVAVGDNGTILYNDNIDGDMGQSWYVIVGIDPSINFSDIQFFEGKFIAVGNNSSGDAILMTSEDGKVWNTTTTNLGKMVINGISGY